MEPKPNCVWYETDAKEIQGKNPNPKKEIQSKENILLGIKQLPEVYLYWS